MSPSTKARALKAISALAGLAVLAAGVAFVLHIRAHRLAVPVRFQPRPAGSPGSRPAVREARGQKFTLDQAGNYVIDSETHRPVFLTGDAAWSLQVQLSDEDIQLYLDDRAAKGFTAVLINLADNFYSDHAPADFYGNVPFQGADFINENPAYWKRVDQTILWAASRGIAVLADPAFVGYDCTGGYCPSLRKSSVETLDAYGRFLGHRYQESSNIIWVIGGDADPSDLNVQSKLYALASGIRAADSVHLITTENYRGTSSAEVWGEAAWLDLNALYDFPLEIPARARLAYRAKTYPSFLLEDFYEGEHSMSEMQVRQEGYWAVLSGATLGRVFGNYAIWNFSWSVSTKDPWKGQLDSAGSKGQEYLGRLFRSREHWKLEPDTNHSVLTGGYDSRGLLRMAKDLTLSWLTRAPERASSSLSVAGRTSDGQTIIAYVPNGNTAHLTIDLTSIRDAGSQAKAWWYNPRDGLNSFIGVFPATGPRVFTAPDPNDWVLVIDSLASNLPAPGTKDL